MIGRPKISNTLGLSFILLLAIQLDSSYAARRVPNDFGRMAQQRQNLAIRSFVNKIRGGDVNFARKRPQNKPIKQADDDSHHKATIATSVFNLANNVAGAGILTLAAGKATGTGWVPAILICVGLAFASSYTFSLIGKACEMTGENSFKGLWGKAFGPNTAFIVDSMVFLQTFISCTIYLGLVGDLFSALLRHTNWNWIPAMLIKRNSIILIAATFIFWPLNMIQDLSALAFTSILGLIAIVYTVFFVVVRSLDGTYSLNPPGIFIVDGVIDPPNFAKSTMWNFDLNSLVLMANLGLAFIAHYNATSYWSSLSNATSERFTKVSLLAYFCLAVLYTTVMCAGYATFGDTSKGNLLLNYHPSDVLSTLGRLATGFSIIFGFPLISNGKREGFKNASFALGWKAVSNPKHRFKLVTSLLIATTIASILLSDIKLLAGLSGSVLGSALVFICPTIIYSRIVCQLKGIDSQEYKVSKIQNDIFIPFGIFTCFMGVAMTLKNTVFAQK